MSKTDRLQDIEKSLNKPGSSSKVPSIFWCKGSVEISDGSNCCFNHWIGLPRKQGKRLPLFDYEESLEDTLKDHKLIWILKSTGLGISEFFLRWMSFKALTDQSIVGSRMLIIVGPNESLAKILIERIKRLFDERPGYIIRSTDYQVEFPFVTIQSTPSNHFDASRSYEDLSVFYGDEACFFLKRDDSIIRNVAERYIGKSNPYIMWVSTPGFPKGLMYNISQEKDCKYKRIYLPYTVGLNKIYDNALIEKAKLTRSFQSEYNLQFGTGMGDIFDLESLSDNPSFNPSEGNRVLACDPAFGSSKFGLVITEQRSDGLIYTILANQFSRPATSDMLKVIQAYIDEFHIQIMYIDSAHPGIAKEFEDVVTVRRINFRELAAKMTIHASNAVTEKKVKIHPTHTELLQQLKSAKYNQKGTIDKNLGTFDLYDAFIMAIYHYHTEDITLINVDDPIDYERTEKYTCNACKDGIHPMEKHEFLVMEGRDDDLRHCNCICATCKMAKEVV